MILSRCQVVLLTYFLSLQLLARGDKQLAWLSEEGIHFDLDHLP